MNFEWGPKVNHFAARTVKLKTVPGLENIAAEILVIFLLLVFAVRAWETKLILLLVPCAVGAVVVTVTLVIQIYMDVHNRRRAKANRDNET